MDDVFGTAARDFFMTKNKNLVIETRSSLGDEDEIPVYYLFRSRSEMPPLEVKALEVSKGAVLEIGCGVGSHLLELNSPNSFGIDSSLLSIEIAKRRGAQNVKVSTWQNYISEQKFDSILLLMNGLGLAGSLNKLPSFLLHLSKWLLPGGSIIADSSDINYLFEEEDDGGVWMPATAYYGDLTYSITYQKSRSQFDWLFVSFEELLKVCVTLGFKCEKIFEGENNHYLARITP